MVSRTDILGLVVVLTQLGELKARLFQTPLLLGIANLANTDTRGMVLHVFQLEQVAKITFLRTLTLRMGFIPSRTTAPPPPKVIIVL